MGVLTNLDDYGVWTAAVVAGLGALGWLARKTWLAVRVAKTFLQKIDALLDLADHELKPNSGASLKDKVDRTADGLDTMTGIVDDMSEDLSALRERFDTHLGTQAEANRAMWPAIEAVAKADPGNH